jgi:hypothetical protein
MDSEFRGQSDLYIAPLLTFCRLEKNVLDQQSYERGDTLLATDSAEFGYDQSRG